jgi:phosphatidylglycerol:prolipoprotein diacylglycerol transferase
VEGQMVLDVMGYPMQTGIYSTQVAMGQIQAGAEQCLSVLPSQLFLSANNLCIVIVALLVARKERRPGVLFAIFLLGYGAGRFIIEFFRGDYLTHYFGLTISQIICMVAFGVGVWVLRTSLKRPPHELDTP